MQISSEATKNASEKKNQHQELKYFSIWLFSSDKKVRSERDEKSPWYVWEEFCYFAVDMMRFSCIFSFRLKNAI